jgi:hypothetical protein
MNIVYASTPTIMGGYMDGYGIHIRPEGAS